MSTFQLRHYIDRLRAEGYTVRDDHGEDPDLIDINGRAVDTWRENYPYDDRMDRNQYEVEKYLLQIELLKFQRWQAETGHRQIIVFEGRDAAGKGGTIKRFTEYINIRQSRTVALIKPTETEMHQWYFQRYVSHLPSRGELVLFDRSWYNRAGVERVMGFCTDSQYETFMEQAPIFEKMLVDSGIGVTKFWFSVTREEQKTRFAIRQLDPVRRWKLSPMDLESINRWEDYSRAKDAMFVHTDIPEAPWYTVESEDKKRSRINVISHLLSTIPWEKLEPPKLEIPERPEETDYVRPPREEFRYVPDVASQLLDD